MGTGKTYSTKYLLDSNNSSGVAGQVLSTTSTGIDWVDANTVPGAGLWLASGNNIYNSNSGNVGIGVTSPTAPLDVFGVRAGRDWAINNRAVIRLDSNGVSSPSDLLFGHTGAANQTSWTGVYWALSSRGSADAGRFNFYRGSGHDSPYNSEAVLMTLDPSLKVGIGTTSPGTKLTIGDPGGATTRSIEIEGNSSATGMSGFMGYFSNGLYLTNNYYYNSAQIHPVSTYGQTNIVCQTGTTTGSNYITFNISDHTDSNNAPDVRMRIMDSGNVGIGTTTPVYKLDVNGGVQAGGVVTYTKAYASLNTTGNAVAGLIASTNGQSAAFTFTCFGHSGGYQKIVYSCYNGGGNWYASKVIDEGTNQLEVAASANSTTITFTFKSRSGTLSYTPRVVIEAVGTAINSTYA